MELSSDLSLLKDKKILITGGLGFIGSSLAIELARWGAKITLVDSMFSECGGNFFNVDSIKNDVQIHLCDIRDQNLMNEKVKDKDYIFHLAAQNSHILSLSNPFPDIDINIKGTAILLEAVRKHAPHTKIVYTGTRGQYGKNIALPVHENSPMNPLGIYELSRLTAEKMIRIYYEVHKIPAVMLRLTNIYGPRSQMKHNHFGVVNWFVRQALDNEEISVYGDGSLLRDFLYIDDCVKALLLCAVSPDINGEVFNVGHSQATSFLDLIKSIVRLAGSGSWRFTPFSPERLAQEPGHFYSDISKIKSRLGWGPTVPLEEGLLKTIEYYRKNRDYYWGKNER